MSAEPVSRRRWQVRLGRVVIPTAGLAVAVVAVGDQVRLRLRQAAICSPAATVRTRALYQVAREREGRLADAVHAALEAERDRAGLEAAGYAALRIGDPRGVKLLQRRADEGPDDAVRAKLILYAARLSQRDVRLIEWLTAGASSTEPWRRAGSAVGLLALGRPRGGEILIERAPDFEPDVLRFVVPEFQRIAEPMADAVGRPLDWSGAREGRLNDEQWADLRLFWQSYGTVTLLNDVLTRLERRDGKWHEVNRLLHARDRVAAWLE